MALAERRSVLDFSRVVARKNNAESEWPHPRRISRGGDYFFFFFAAFFVAKTLTPLRRSC
jgi:hypothetical protein